MQCFFWLGYPEKRCANDAKWKGDPDAIGSIAHKFVWCDAHKFPNDIPLVIINHKE